MSLDQVIRAYETALNANDTDTILGLYSAEPVFMPQGAPARVGRAAVRAGYAHVCNTRKLNVGFTVHEIEEVWRLRRALWVPLLGWWSHIVIDVFTHSADYYASPVLYPFTERGFDGIAWNTPWFMVANYLALGAAGLWVWITFKRGST